MRSRYVISAERVAEVLRYDPDSGLGYFDTPEEAHAAYLAAKRAQHEGCTL